MEILTLQNISFTYPDSKNAVLNGVSLQIKQGEFAVLCGATGSGKSTLIKLINKSIAPKGTLSGDICVCEHICKNTDIAYVAQHTEQQIVTDTVWHELAFGAESMGISQSEIRLRVCETAQFFGIEHLFYRKTDSLSGGEKQLVSLAAATVTRPAILLLDEPCSQLDPISAAAFTGAVARLNRELGITVLVAEHNLEEVLPFCDKLVLLDKGRVVYCGAPGFAMQAMQSVGMQTAMPVASQVFDDCIPLPVTVKHGHDLLLQRCKNTVKTVQKPAMATGKTVLRVKDICFRYKRNADDVLHGLSMELHSGEILCLLGGNGSGKSTALGVMAGLLKPYSGTVKIDNTDISRYGTALYNGILALLPQDVQTVFTKDTLRQELCFNGNSAQAVCTGGLARLLPLLDKHPYDLSGGEQQLAALARVLLCKPRILLLDEPTKGMDALIKADMINVLKNAAQNGTAMIIVTHDVAFAAEVAGSVWLIFGGEITASGEMRQVLGNNCFFTTPAVRMCAGFYQNAVTVQDVRELMELNGYACNR